jgi:hypothetical protein
VRKISLARLLTLVEALYRRYIVFASRHQSCLTALWTAHTHALAAADFTPYLHVTSPRKRSGKTRELEVAKRLTPRPWGPVIRPGEAVFYRKIAADCPTALLDEIDSVFKDKMNTHEGLRAALDAGYERGAVVPRCAGERGDEVRDFPVFCPKALAGIGPLPDTVADRSIPIRLKRKRRDERVRRFRRRDVNRDASPIRVALERAFGQQVIDTLRDARPDLPAALHDRAQDVMEPLLAIADLAGGLWPKRVREAAVALCGDAEAQQGDVDVALLGAIRDVYAHRNDPDFLSTEDLFSVLSGREDESIPRSVAKALKDGEAKWPGKWLAGRLRPFEVYPSEKKGVGRGYWRAEFNDTWDRTCPPPALPSPTSFSTHPPSGSILMPPTLLA